MAKVAKAAIPQLEEAIHKLHKRRPSTSLQATPSPSQQPRLQLVVHPLVKNAVSQRETSAEVDTWSGETPTVAAWPKVMQFKLNGHLVDGTKSEQCWNR
ncbi:hypothetical protein PI126_g7475 [Phytophthora idaei]|nr:hypothetical protein PI126_g7475 [Phytophthora idaei]